MLLNSNTFLVGKNVGSCLIFICRFILLLLLLLLLTAIELSLGGSSPYTSTDKTK